MLRKSKPAAPEKPFGGLQSKITKKTTAPAASKYTCNYHVCLGLETSCTNSAPFPNGICKQHLAEAQSVVDYHSMMKENQALSLMKESVVGTQSSKNKASSKEKEQEEEEDDNEECPVVCEGCYSRFHEDDIQLFDYPDGTIDPLCKTCYKVAELSETKQKKQPPAAISWDD